MDIPDDPIVSCIERTGYPPWYWRSRSYDDYEEPDWEEDDEDEVYT